MTSLKCVHTLYNKTSINVKAHFKQSQSYIYTHPLQLHKHKYKGLLPKIPVLHVYIPSTTTQEYTQILIAKITSHTCVHTFSTSVHICYNNTPLPKFKVLHV